MAKINVNKDGFYVFFYNNSRYIIYSTLDEIVEFVRKEGEKGKTFEYNGSVKVFNARINTTRIEIRQILWNKIYKHVCLRLFKEHPLKRIKKGAD